MVRIVDPRLKAKAKCPSCGATRPVPMEQYEIGQTLQPFPGGGNYGYCLRCKRSGLVVVEVPKEEAKKPVGWRDIPKE